MHTLHAPHGITIAWGKALPDRRQASRRMLRSLLRSQLGEGFELIQQCPACGSAAHGPLRVGLNAAASAAGDMSASGAVAVPRSVPRAVPCPVPLVSVSYAGSLVVVGVAPAGASAFGIDVEVDSPATRAAVTEALGGSGERGASSRLGTPGVPGSLPQVRDWTRLEAIAKAHGRGLRGDWAAYAASAGTGTGTGTGALECFELALPGAPAGIILSIAHK
ncbi:hypothetical protein JOF28_002694 [Leucobacter exalbidus]|uniref:4'-phosphopantetheinyl transferase superfamily protein n=1 Tax=Leucobacter exalbidus TaxID=662960 RepID=A0A940PUZ2_9MICO|nr:hypothetical protein [Leucobacter exalbidus]MBP1327462.1 hypothetical protein [Leucobacter exalbidus]